MRQKNFLIVVATLFCVTFSGCTKPPTLDDVSEPPTNFIVSEVKVNGVSQSNVEEPLKLKPGLENTFDIVIKQLRGARGLATGTIKLLKSDGTHMVIITGTNFVDVKTENGKPTRLQFKFKVPEAVGESLMQIRAVHAGVICELRCVIEPIEK